MRLQVETKYSLEDRYGDVFTYSREAMVTFRKNLHFLNLYRASFVRSDSYCFISFSLTYCDDSCIVPYVSIFCVVYALDVRFVTNVEVIDICK